MNKSLICKSRLYAKNLEIQNQTLRKLGFLSHLYANRLYAKVGFIQKKYGRFCVKFAYMQWKNINGLL